MNFEDWRKIGSLTKIIRYSIMELRHGYTKSSKEAGWLYSAEKGIDRVRDKLDNLVFEQCPEEDTNDLTNVFYGPFIDKKNFELFSNCPLCDGKTDWISTIVLGENEYGRFSCTICKSLSDYHEIKIELQEINN